MSEFKGTKGIWYVDGEHIVADSGDCQSNETICDLSPVTDYNTVAERSPAEQICNSRLIASAPELLEALQLLLYGWESEDGNHDVAAAFRQAEAAIKKALGE